MLRSESKITASHRSRKCLVYVRQSTMAQVRGNTESTARQYGLAGEAARLGWAAQDIEVIDADLGLSGRSADNRAGFKEIIARVCLGEVGAIFGLEQLKAKLGEANAGRAERWRAHCPRPKDRPRGVEVKKLRDLEVKVEALVAEHKALPERVSAKEAGGREVTRREAKAIVDRVKIAAYNAEEWLLDRLMPHYGNHHDVRDLLRAFAELSGTIDTTVTGVLVSLDPPDTLIHRHALRGLVDDLNAIGARFPGTDVPVTYQIRLHHSELVA